MVTRYQRKPDKNIVIAQDRVKKLFTMADEVFEEHPELSDRYVDLARKMAMKFKVKMTSFQRRKYCKHCYKYLRPGVNCRVRTVSGKLVYSCFSCKKYTRVTMTK